MKNKYKQIHSNAALALGRHCLFLIICLLGFILLCDSLAFSSSTAASRFYALRNQCLNEIKKSRTGTRLSRSHIRYLSKKCVKFQKTYPSSTFAPRVLYLSGRMWEELYYTSEHFNALNQALKFYGKVTALYTFSHLSDDALFRRGVLYLKIGLKRLALSEFRKLKKRYPGSDLKKLTNLHIRLLSNTKLSNHLQRKGPYFKGFRYWANNHYARLVMDFSSKTVFRSKILNYGNRTRVTLYFKALKNGKSVRTTYGKPNEFLQKAQLSGRSNKLAVSVSFKAKGQVKVFTLFSPFRIVVDAIALSSGVPENHLRTVKKGRGRKFTVCLDPGHGGKDPGATGPHGIHEKDVVLRIARILKRKLEKTYGCRVIMTRNRDIFIPLEQRVAFANSKGADLFVSIHINASRNRRLQGIATFCLSNTSDRKSLRLAARENGITMAQMSQADKILSDMLFSEKYNESFKVAHTIHHDVMNHVQSYQPGIRDLGVRFAPFYVLVGAKMPAVLLELDFISNPSGEKRLLRTVYLDKIADGIASGVIKTKNTINVAALNTN